MGRNKRTYGPQGLIEKVAKAALEKGGVGLKNHPLLSEVTAADAAVIQRVVGMSVEEFNQRIGSKLDQLSDKILDRMLETVEETPLTTLGFNLSVAIDKRQRLAGMSAAGNAAVNIQVNNYGDMSKEEILAKLTGRNIGRAIAANVPDGPETDRMPGGPPLPVPQPPQPPPSPVNPGNPNP